MQSPAPIDRIPYTAFRVWLIEKLIINFALPSDLLWHTIRAIRQRDKSQNTFQRIYAMWVGKVEKYQKLLRVKYESGGTIPPDYQDLCRQTPCGKVRLFLATRSNRKPRIKKH